MPCYKPQRAWRNPNTGTVTFVGPQRLHNIKLPCGKCIGCRIDYSRTWAIRILHESQLHTDNSFITLTFREDELEKAQLEGRSTLDYIYFQKFMKRVRKHNGAGIRFFMCGEYGTKFGRPHFHAALFGKDFLDRYPWRKTPSGSISYRSPELEKLWPHGNAECGDLTYESAAYIARYVMKKITGTQAADHYTKIDRYGNVIEVQPEYCNMSRRPGVGKPWFDKYLSDVYPHDHVIIGGQRMKPPRYYDKLLSLIDGETFDQIKEQRTERAFKNAADNTPARLAVKETVTKARVNLKRRNLEDE